MICWHEPQVVCTLIALFPIKFWLMSDLKSAAIQIPIPIHFTCTIVDKIRYIVIITSNLWSNHYIDADCKAGGLIYDDQHNADALAVPPIILPMHNWSILPQLHAATIPPLSVTCSSQTPCVVAVQGFKNFWLLWVLPTFDGTAACADRWGRSQWTPSRTLSLSKPCSLRNHSGTQRWFRGHPLHSHTLHQEALQDPRPRQAVRALCLAGSMQKDWCSNTKHTNLASAAHEGILSRDHGLTSLPLSACKLKLLDYWWWAAVWLILQALPLSWYVSADN